jgi:hypothetical protein
MRPLNLWWSKRTDAIRRPKCVAGPLYGRAQRPATAAALLGESLALDMDHPAA